MSWKNLASIAVCAMLASPALAVPTLHIANTGLNANGDWVWTVSVTPDTSFFIDNPPNGVGGSVAVELGLTASGGAGLLAGSPATTHANVEFQNPGNVIFGWEALTDVQDPALPDVPNMKPVGLQSNVPTDEIFAALGSTYFTTGGQKQILTVITDGPSLSNLTSSLALHGNSIIAQNRPGTDDTDDFAAGSATRTVIAGDANVNGITDLDDLIILSANFNDAGTFHWGQANFDGDTDVDLDDLIALSSKFNQSGGSNTPLNSTPSGSGAGGGAAVPEPATFALAGLALLAGLGLVRRK